MPDPWLSEEELKEHNKEVENHPLTKQAEDAAEAHEKDAEELHKQQEKDRKAVEAGDKVPVYANGAVVGYRDADDVDAGPAASEFAEGFRPKEEATNEGAAADDPVVVTDEGAQAEEKSSGKKSDKSDKK